MKKTILFLLLGASALVRAQYAPVNGSCTLGGVPAQVSGLPSSNYLQGIVPSCTVTVYLTGTTTKATIYSDAGITPLANPFTASTTGLWQFQAAVNTGLDVVVSGGHAPNVYPAPQTIQVNTFPGAGGSGCIGGGSLAQGCTGATSAPGALASIFAANVTSSGTGNNNAVQFPNSVSLGTNTVFGVVGADATGVAFSTAAFQTAVTALCASSGKTLQPNAGTYKLNGAITATGCTNARINLTGVKIIQTAVHTPIFAFTNASHLQIEGGWLYGVGTDYVNSPSGYTNADGLQFTTSTDVTVHGTIIDNFGESGIYACQNNGLSFSDIIINGPGGGIVPSGGNGNFGIFTSCAGGGGSGYGNYAYSNIVMLGVGMGYFVGNDYSHIAITGGSVSTVGQHGFYGYSSYTTISGADVTAEDTPIVFRSNDNNVANQIGNTVTGGVLTGKDGCVTMTTLIGSTTSMISPHITGATCIGPAGSANQLIYVANLTGNHAYDIVGAQIADNTLYNGTAGYGILFENGTASILNNDLTNAQWSCIYAQGSYVRIRGNKMSDCGLANDGNASHLSGILVDNYTTAEVEGNTVLPGPVTIVVGVNPTPSDTITINGTVITFVAAGAVGNQVNIGGTGIITALNLYTLLSASVDANLVKSTYAYTSGLNSLTAVPNTVATAQTLAASNTASILFSGPTTETPYITSWITTGPNGVNILMGSGNIVPAYAPASLTNAAVKYLSPTFGEVTATNYYPSFAAAGATTPSLLPSDFSFGFVNNDITNYPDTFGSVLSYQKSASNYTYSWQMFKGVTANTPLFYRSAATSANTWGPWQSILGGGVVYYTSTQAASLSDNGKLVVMNCAGACAYSLGVQPSKYFHTVVQTIGATNATISLSGGVTYNGSASLPVLKPYRLLPLWADTATSTNYQGESPLVAGTNITFTTATNGMTVATSTPVSTAAAVRAFCLGAATANATLYLYGMGQVASTGCATTTATAQTGFLANRTGVFQNLYCDAGSNGGGGGAGDGVYVIRDLTAGSDTALTCTLGTGLTCTDVTHTVTATTGHLYAYKLTTALGTGINSGNCTADFQ